MFVSYKTISNTDSKIVEQGCDFIITQLKTPRGVETTLKGWFGTQESVEGNPFRVFSLISFIGEKTLNISNKKSSTTFKFLELKLREDLKYYNNLQSKSEKIFLENCKHLIDNF